MSMTRKGAIKVLKNGGIEVCGEADRISEFIAALDVALDALIPPTRENELEAENIELKERIVNWRNYMAPTREQVEKMRGEWTTDGVCSRCGFDAMYYKGVPVQVRTNYCPTCGSPMTDEAVETIMKRMEEMRND